MGDKVSSNWLNPEELCKIIDKCGKNGVEQLKLTKSGCFVKFSGEKRPDQPVLIATDQVEDVLERDEVQTKEDQLDQMLIEDPVEYERQLAQGELNERENT